MFYVLKRHKRLYAQYFQVKQYLYPVCKKHLHIWLQVLDDFQIFDLPLKEFKIYNPKLYTLDINYRSCEAIVDFNNSVFCRENIKVLLDCILDKKNVTDVEKYCAIIGFSSYKA